MQVMLSTGKCACVTRSYHPGKILWNATVGCPAAKATTANHSPSVIIAKAISRVDPDRCGLASAIPMLKILTERIRANFSICPNCRSVWYQPCKQFGHRQELDAWAIKQPSELTPEMNLRHVCKSQKSLSRHSPVCSGRNCSTVSLQSLWGACHAYGAVIGNGAAFSW